MTRHAAYCWAVILAVFAESSAAQALQQPAEVKTESSAEIAPDPNSDASASKRPNVGFDPLQNLTMKISNASYLSDRGDSSQSIEEWRQTYYEAMALVRTSPSGSDIQFEAIRRAEQAGNTRAWMLANDQQLEAAEKIYQELLEVLKPYGLAKPPAPLVLPLASTYWLGSRLAYDRGNNQDDINLTRRTEELTIDLDVYPGDYVSLASLRAAVLSYNYGLKPDQVRARKNEACKLASDIYRVRPDSFSLRSLVECDLDRARTLLSEKKIEEAIKLAEASRSRLLSDIKSNGEATPISVRFFLVHIELALKEIALFRQANVEISRREIAAAEAFILALQGRSYHHRNTTEVKDAFFGFKDVDFTKIPEFTTNRLLKFDPTAEGFL